MGCSDGALYGVVAGSNRVLYMASQYIAGSIKFYGVVVGSNRAPWCSSWSPTAW